MACNLFGKCLKEKGNEIRSTGRGVFIMVVKNRTRTSFFAGFVFYCYDFNYSVNVILLPGLAEPLLPARRSRRLINDCSRSDRHGDKLLPAKHINYRETGVIFHFTSLLTRTILHLNQPSPPAAFLSRKSRLSTLRCTVAANQNK